MDIRVWTADYAPFPREGLNHLLPSENDQVTMLLRREASKMARLSQLDPPETAAALKRFQKRLRSQLWEKLGVTYTPGLPLEVEEHGVIPQKGFSIHKITYQGRPGIHVTALLYVPDGDGPFPAVIHPHGHHAEGKMGDRQQNMSMALAENGYVVLAPDCFGVYERAVQYREREYHGGFLGSSLFNLGESLMGAQLVDNMRGVDLLASLPYVQKDRIGATGASGGGNQTMWLTAMDTRIRAAMPVVSVGSFESYVTGVNCVCELLPDGMTLTEEAGVLALIAPRPLRIGNALYDVNPTFGVADMLRTYHQVEKVYWNLGVADNLAYTVADHVHGMQPQQRQAVLGWFACHLKGEGQGRPRPAPPAKMLSFDELAMFPSHEARPAKVRTIADHCILRGKELHDALLARQSIVASDARKGLAKVLRLRPQPTNPTLKRYADVDGVQRYALEVGDHLIPILVATGKRPAKVAIVLHANGKSAVPQEKLEELLASHSLVVLADLFGTGETAQPNQILGMNHQYFRQLLWIGRSLPGEWVFDILALTRMIRRRHGVSPDVFAYQEAGACAVFAAALDKGLVVEAIDSPASLRFRRDSIPSFRGNAFATRMAGNLYTPMMALPGFLPWGDVSLAAALAGGKAKVRFTSPRGYDGTPYTSAEGAALDKEVATLGKRLK
ncbi:MAG: acetylxylan esterase [Victivallales bacterium]|nr:acetylxylan esterase [Victivallales bacterium]